MPGSRAGTTGREGDGRRADRRGMTLVEMTVALSIFGVVMAVIFTFLVNSRQSYTEISSRVEYQQSMRAVVSLLSREIRTAGCDPQEAGFDRIAVATATLLQCRMDLDGDGLIEVVEPAEDVTYQYLPDSRELTRDSGSGAQVILREVDNLTFDYFDGEGNPLGPPPLAAADREEVGMVEVAIAGTTEHDEPVEYTARIVIRNE